MTNQITPATPMGEWADQWAGSSKRRPTTSGADHCLQPLYRA